MMITSPEVEELVDKIVNFVLEHRIGNKSFKDWTPREIESVIRSRLYNGWLLYATNETDNIIGVVHGNADIKTKLFHVENVLIIRPRVLIMFARRFKTMFPGYTLAAIRYGKPKIYKDFNKFERKLLITERLPIIYNN